MPKILAEFPDAGFCLACRIKTEDDRLYERKILGRLEAEGLRKFVHVVNATDDFPALASVSDIAVLPVSSLYAKMDIPLAVIDCLALGKPVVLAAVGPLKEILKKEGGKLIPPRAPEALSGAVIGILNDKSLYKKMGVSARQIAEEYFDIRKLALRYMELYKELRDEKVN
jgi:glycosyltransferase involved in cell wall biosynthesis